MNHGWFIAQSAVNHGWFIAQSAVTASPPSSQTSHILLKLLVPLRTKITLVYPGGWWESSPFSALLLLLAIFLLLASSTPPENRVIHSFESLTTSCFFFFFYIVAYSTFPSWFPLLYLYNNDYPTRARITFIIHRKRKNHLQRLFQ